MIVFPNVKLNLGLRVLGKREDGYHELQTVFVPYFGYYDTLEIIPARMFDIAVTGSEYTGWEPAEDLCAKAWRLLRADFGIGPVQINLEKTSPVGAGLGGGSADGAFTLLTLNEMFSLGLGLEKLAEYASYLGSDCAFFIYNRPMYATGRGEVLEEFDLPLDGFKFDVSVPKDVHVSTREAYAGIEIPSVEGEEPEEGHRFSHWKVEPDGVDLRNLLLSTPVSDWRSIIVNDFEPSVFKSHPEIAAAKQALYDRGAVYAAMSGSGSAVFGIFAE